MSRTLPYAPKEQANGGHPLPRASSSGAEKLPLLGESLAAVVIGGGPAGLYVTQGLAQRGWTVLVLEARPDERTQPR